MLKDPISEKSITQVYCVISALLYIDNVDSSERERNFGI